VALSLAWLLGGPAAEAWNIPTHVYAANVVLDEAARVLEEHLGCRVAWDGGLREVLIDGQPLGDAAEVAGGGSAAGVAQPLRMNGIDRSAAEEVATCSFR
jgi:hypothetical protein